MAKNILHLLLFGIVIIMTVSLIPANSPNAISFAIPSQGEPISEDHKVFPSFVNRTVVWHNDDHETHTITSGNHEDGPDGMFDSGLIAPGDSFSFDFGSEGVFDYYCTEHPDKTRKIIVQTKQDDGSTPNTPTKANLTVIKNVVNDNGGTSLPGDFTMLITAANPSDGIFAGSLFPGTTITIDPGEYLVSETGPVGYVATLSTECSGIAVAGNSYTCTVSYDAEGSKSLTTSPLEDSDHDGIPNVVDQCPEDPESKNSAALDGCPDDQCQDTDGDGLCKEYEESIGTLPDEPDTDLDSLWDGVEDQYTGTNATRSNDCNPTTVEFDISLDRISKMDKSTGTFTAKFGIETVTRHGNSSYDLTAHIPDFDFENNVGKIENTTKNQKGEKHTFEGIYEGDFIGVFNYSKYPLERFSFPIKIKTPGKDECELKYNFSGHSVFSNNPGPLNMILSDFETNLIRQDLVEINFDEKRKILNKTFSQTEDGAEKLSVAEDLIRLGFEERYDNAVKQSILEISVDGKGDDGFGIIKNIFPIMLMTSLAVIVFWLPKDFMTKIELNALFLISAVLFTQLIQFESSFVTSFTMYDVVIFSSYLVFLISIAVPVIQLKFEQSGKAPEKISKADSIGRIVMVIAICLSIAITVAGYAGLYRL